MRCKYIYILFVALCFASSAQAAIAFDSTAGHFACAGQTSTSTNTVTLTVTFTAGNTGIVIVAFPNNTTTVTRVTDNATTSSSAYGTNPNLRKVNGTTSSVEIWYTGPGGVRAGVTSVTVLISANGRFAVCADNYSGVLGIGGTGAGGTGSSTAPSAAQTTQDANNFIVAGMGRAAGTSTWTASAGNLRTNYGGATSTSCAAIMDNTAASPGSVTNTATLGTTGVWAVATVELRTVINKTVLGVR